MDWSHLNREADTNRQALLKELASMDPAEIGQATLDYYSGRPSDKYACVLIHRLAFIDCYGEPFPDDDDEEEDE